MKKVLILFAHPALHNSRVNSELIKDLDKNAFITFHDLYELYPSFDIDINYEQSLLLEHDIIIFMFPMFWYSSPAILKEWQDIVLEHDWAYGSKGDKLEGKVFMQIITTGGKASAYTQGGYNNFTIRQFLAPLEQTAKLCRMEFLPPYTVSGTHSITKEKVTDHKLKIEKMLRLLSEEKIDLFKAQSLELINNYFQEN